LVRAEFGVVRAGGIATAKRAAFALALLAAAAVAALLVVIFLLGAGPKGWRALPPRLAGMADHGGLILVVGVLLGWLGYRMLKKTIVEGRRVGATVKEDLEWVTRLPRQRENGS